MRRTKGLQQGSRSQRVIQSVHEATLAELARVGYAGLTIEKVAAEAGVHRTTVYRRWPNRQALVASLIEPGTERVRAIQPAHDLQSDLFALARRLADDLADPVGRALATLLVSPAPELREVVRSAREQLDQAVADAYARAMERGEIAGDVDVDTRVHLLMSGVVHLALATDGPLEDAAVHRVLEVLQP